MHAPLLLLFKRVSSLETHRLIAFVGGDPEQCRREIKTWGHGGCWADVKPEHYFCWNQEEAAGGRCLAVTSLSVQLLEPVEHDSDLGFDGTPTRRRIPQAYDSHSVRHKVETTFHATRGVEERFFGDGRCAERKGRGCRHWCTHKARTWPRYVDELFAVCAPHWMMCILGAIGDLVFSARLRERFDVDVLRGPDDNGCTTTLAWSQRPSEPLTGATVNNTARPPGKRSGPNALSPAAVATRRSGVPPFGETR
jgi:hypothetical protein